MRQSETKMEEKRPRGRPRVDAPLRRRNVTITLRGPLRATLEETAAANERSLSAEIEYQLEERALLRGLMPTFGRPDLFWQMHLLANVIAFVEKKTGKVWDEDPETTHEAIKAVITTMTNLRRAKWGGDPVAGDESLGGTIGKIAVENFNKAKAEGHLSGQQKTDEEEK